MGKRPFSNILVSYRYDTESELCKPPKIAEPEEVVEMNRENIGSSVLVILAQYAIKHNISDPKKWLEKLDLIDAINICQRREK